LIIQKDLFEKQIFFLKVFDQ